MAGCDDVCDGDRKWPEEGKPRPKGSDKRAVRDEGGATVKSLAGGGSDPGLEQRR